VAATEVVTSLDDIPRLKQVSSKGVLIYGSLSLVRQLSDRSLIDEYQLLVHPVALGGGTSLFVGLSSRLALTLVDQESWASGITVLEYRRA
jgi:dihydrofolate reductase